MSALVRASGVGKTYSSGPSAVTVLDDVSLEIHANQLTLLMGPSGSGKTTLISVMAGLMRPTRGEVELCGASLSRMTESAMTKVRRENLGFVFQQYHLFPALTALENVSQVLKLKGKSSRDARARAAEVLTRVGLGSRLDHKPAALSGGEKQRVAVARALCDHPAVVFGDEVTAALDAQSAHRVVELLRGHVGPGRAVLLVTHDHRLEPFADRIVTMEDGRIVGDRLTSETSRAREIDRGAA
jgi:putative ABC transport system ATP-binding protein